VRVLVGMPEQGAQGGPAACEPPFIEELRRLGHEVEKEIYAHAAVNVGFRSRARRVLKTARVLRERLRQSDFDLVYINTAFDMKALMRDALIVPRLRFRRTKLFLKFHGSDAGLLETKNPVLATLRRRVLSHADGIGVLSSEERANFLCAGIPEKKVFLVKNVVEGNSHQRNSKFLRHWSLPDDRPLLLFIGRFIPTKGLLDVIRACGLLRNGGQKFVLLCLGDGPARSEAETQVRRLNLQDHVRFFGYIPEDQTGDFYVNGDVLLFPTYHIEGFPMVIFNAAAAGLPIITTRIRAAADYLAEPENCLWVEPRNPSQLAEAILTLFSKSEVRKAMSANNRMLVERFSAETVTREYLKVFDRVLS
jgi:glycosyltransferase involved in cell wall biosynthesis